MPAWAASPSLRVYLERSPALIASLLGVWKAGGAYLPIDPTNPRQRVAATLEDADVAFVLTERTLAGSLPPSGGTVLCVEDLPSAAQEQATNAMRPRWLQRNPSPASWLT